MTNDRTSFPLGLVWAILLVGLVSGCRGGWLPPAGTMNQQQANAIAHDPFPQQAVGPSDLGARPPDYQQPLPAPVSNRLVPDSMPWLGR
ncbi:hypothetical protein K227x_13040 [Rubripirellula lacrimiformis]|uniref:Membrane or secreted protein n=1 Tax=Rubripirellula lacrimiformis TaxID=1930273 RepID=A0A517N723_9BACT|nr:membrane or secreted protein [Rubripirellula lacrimiformis]QDT02925.1 hypothetical protein K227x_13040 [Rubripirellula lacrimiformis]